MSFTAQPLVQAREALVDSVREKAQLIAQVEEQAQQIAELYRELQTQIAATASVMQTLTEARTEIDRLRAELPDEATRAAYNALSQIVSSTRSEQPAGRTAEAKSSAELAEASATQSSSQQLSGFVDETRSARLAA